MTCGTLFGNTEYMLIFKNIGKEKDYQPKHKK